MEDKNKPWLNKVLEWVINHEDSENEEIDKKEKIGCPITLGEYEEIIRQEKENNDN